MAVRKTLKEVFFQGTGPNFIELLKQRILLDNFLLSSNEQDTSHNLSIWHGSLAGSLILVSTFLVLSSSMKLGPGHSHFQSRHFRHGLTPRNQKLTLTMSLAYWCLTLWTGLKRSIWLLHITLISIVNFVIIIMETFNKMFLHVDEILNCSRSSQVSLNVSQFQVGRSKASVLCSENFLKVCVLNLWVLSSGCVFSFIVPVTPHTRCRLRLLKLERIKDYLLMEEEFIRNQERLKPQEEKDEVCYWTWFIILHPSPLTLG